MDNILIFVVVGTVVVALAFRIGRMVYATWFSPVSRAARDLIAAWCRQEGVPDVPFDIKATVRQVMAGSRPGVSRDGQWWAAYGLEQIGHSDRTRLLWEGALSDHQAVQTSILGLYEAYGGPADLAPHVAEDYVITSIPGFPRDTVIARIMGRRRPVGVWLVAVPPHLIAARATRGGGPVGFGEAIRSGFVHAFYFNGRASRSEYWWWALFQLIALIAATTVGDWVAGDDGATIALGIALLILLVPSFSISVRRLHDTDRSGGWLGACAIPFVGLVFLLVFMTAPGTPGPNRFGD